MRPMVTSNNLFSQSNIVYKYNSQWYHTSIYQKNWFLSYIPEFLHLNYLLWPPMISNKLWGHTEILYISWYKYVHKIKSIGAFSNFGIFTILFDLQWPQMFTEVTLTKTIYVWYDLPWKKHPYKLELRNYVKICIFLLPGLRLMLDFTHYHHI